MRVLELYSGIGGLAAALASVAPRATVVAALDINHLARQVYSANFSHPVIGAAVEFIPVERFRAWKADLWWMSPPCQPFTRRGKQRDARDPRAITFLRAIEHLEEVRPTFLALENVPAFRGSDVHRRLLDTLEASGYIHRRECLLCPSTLGLPNRRLRYYLVAGRRPLAPWSASAGDDAPLPRRPLASFIDTTYDGTLVVDPALQERYAGALHIVDAEDPEAETRTFTSAYGRSPVRSGSYLRQGTLPQGTRHQETVIRRFAPHEILRLLGFPETFRLPPSLPRHKAWQLVGNSLSQPAVRAVLQGVPGLCSAQSFTPTTSFL